MGEKSSLAILEIILHALCAACCIGVLVASALTLTKINDIRALKLADDNTEQGEDRDRYRAVAWWILAVAFAGIITQIILLILRTLFFKKIIISHFVIFGILCVILTTLLALALISGGITSVLNAIDVQVHDPVGLRNSQTASAVLAFIGAGVGVVIIVVVMVTTVIRRDS